MVSEYTTHRLLVPRFAVGGNMGQEPILAALHGFECVTFEPFPSNVETIRFNAAFNCVHPRVRVIPKGTAASPGEWCMTKNSLDAASRTGSSFAGTSVRAAAAGRKVAQHDPSLPCLQLSTLDKELVHSMQTEGWRPLLLKIDNEGNELSTLRGAAKLLKLFPPPVIAFEWIVHYRDQAKDRQLGTATEELHALLKAHGYGIYASWNGDATIPPHATPLHADYYTFAPNITEATGNANVREVLAVHLPTFQQPSWRGIFRDDRVRDLASGALAPHLREHTL